MKKVVVCGLRIVWRQASEFAVVCALCTVHYKVNTIMYYILMIISVFAVVCALCTVHYKVNTIMY
jgi:hypothetical protein